MSFDFSSVKDKKRKVTTSETQEKKTETKKEEKKSSSGFDFYSVQNKTRSSSSSAYDSERLEYLNTKEARDKKYALEQELALVNSKAQAQRKAAGTVATVSAGIRNKTNSADAFIDSSTIDRRNALEQEINALERDINLASRKQTNKYLTDRAVDAEDFGEYSFDPIIPEEKKEYNIYKQANQEREDSSAKYMSEDQKAIYNYYYNKMGEDKAEEYLDSIREDINEKQAEAIFKGNEDNEAAQLLMALATNMERAKEGYQGSGRMLLGDDSYTPKSSAEYLNEMAAEGLYDELVLPKWFEENLGIHSLGQLAYDAVANTGNMLPSMALGLIPIPGMGGLAIGASAAGNAYTEKINEGYSKEQATVYGTIIGASEAALSNVLSTATGGKFLKGKLDEAIENVDKVAARIALKYGAGFLSEGVEEGLQEYLEPLYRNIAFNETNELKITPEVIYAGIVGGLSGGFYAGADAVTSEIGANYKAKQTYGEVQNELIEEGLAAPEGSKAHELAQRAKKKLDEGKELSGNELRRIAKANDKAFSEEENVEASKTETSGEEDLKNLAKEVVEEKAEEATDSVTNKAGRYVQTISKEGLEEYGSKLPNATKDTGRQVAAMYDIKDGVSKETFIKGVDEAYRYGSMNFSLEEMDRGGSFAKDIPSEKKLQAYYMGQRNAETATITKANEQQKKALSGVKGKVVFEGNAATQIKNNKQRSTIRFINSVLKNASSMEYHIFASYEEDGERVYKNSEGKVVPAPNGFYDPKNHQIWIDVNAGAKGQGIMLYTLTHEHVHDIKVWSAEHYNELVKITSQAFEHAGKSFKEAVDVKYAQYKKSHPDTTYEDAQEEVVAEAMSGLLSDEKALREFSEQIQQKDASLWNRIKAWFNDVIARITAAYKGVEPESEEAKLLMEQRELFEHAQKVFAEAVVTAGENYKNYSKEANKATKTESNVKYQARGKENSEVDILYQKLVSKNEELQEARKKKKELEESKEYKDLLDKFGTTNDIESLIEEISKWQEDSGYGKIAETIKKLEQEGRELSSQFDAARKQEASAKESKDIEKSGLSENEYYRKKAVKEFGYTPYFYDAAYVLPNGKMLNFSGEKGAHYGIRGQDHRAIGIIYSEAITGSEAMVKFISEGNIRIMPEGPSVDISSEQEPTKEQYALIKKFVREYGSEETFSVDFTNEAGKTVGSYNFKGRINADRIVNDIKYFYENGKTRETSSVAQFHYSLRTDNGTKFQDRDSDGRELSKEQAEFFKNSKVRDEDGNLLVLYHGGYNDTVFTGRGEGFTYNRNAIYMSEREDIASAFSYGARNTKGNVYELYANIKNPFVIDAEGRSYVDIPIPDDAPESLKDKFWYDNTADLDNLPVWAEQEGYDGIIVYNVREGVGGGPATEVIAFRSNQVKFVDNKTPTADPDIRYSERDFQIKKDVEDLVHQAATGTTTTMHTVGKIDATLNKAINRLENQSSKGGYRGKYEGGERLVSDTAIRHILSQHGDFLTEALRAQFPMTEKDIARHLSAIKDGKFPTKIEASNTSQGKASILTAYEINGYTLYAEEIKKPLEKNSPSGLIGHTMYKAPTLSTAHFGATSATTQLKRQSLVLCEYNNTQNGKLSTGNFVADINGIPAELKYLELNGKAKQNPAIGGLIALSSDASNFTDKNGKIESGYVLCQKPFYITPENRVFSNSDSDLAQIILDLRHKGYDCFIFDKSVGDNYMVAVFNKAQIIKQEPTVKENNLFQDRLSAADKNRVEILENKNARLEKELADLEKAYESVQNYARAEGILIGQVEQGRTMAKEMRQKQATFDRKAKGYENAIAKKKEQISAVRQQKNELLAKAKAERAEAVERVRKADRERMEKAIADIKATERAKFNAAKERSDEQKRAIIEKYQTSIKKATEGRHRTDIRGKIKRVVNELNTLLTKQTKERHIPLELQKPVADALDILNLDDQRYYESRIRGLEARIAEAKSSEERHLLQEELNKIIDHRAAFKNKIAGLKKAYEAIKNSTDPYVAVGYNENIAKMIDRVAEDIGDTLLRDMNMTQLQEVYDLYKGILKTVRDANKFFNEEKGASVVEAGRNVVSEIEASGKTIDQISKKKLERKKFFWNNLKPVYAFKKLGSKTLENLFGGILKGQGTWAKDVSEAKDFFERIGNKYGYKKWDKKKTFEFTSNTGKKFSLNLQQMMSLYAYSKRDQALDHLTDGGFVFDNKETIKKNGKEYVVNTAQAYNISAATLQQIIGKLSTDQRMFVDEMQKYLSETMGAKGNEVSRAMYDIELFREAEGYFPLKSAKQFLYDRNEVTNETRQLVNSGFTKPIQPGANNPIILTGFMDVWANHVNDMSMYHAFVMPIENFNKVYNFQFGRSEESDSKSVKSAIQDSFTEAANQYIEQLLKDINGGARTDSRESNYKRLVGNWKKAAVFASASVVIQQPSAIGRAFAEINPIYFMAPTEIGVLKHKKQWEQVKKYAPVAVIKEMGYFDTDMGQSTAEFIKGEKTLKDRADDVFGWAPAKADEYTWCAIWDAVKRETKAKHKDLNVNSEEFLKIAGERFTEVIDKTQVYDSVLARSGNMRSKSIFMQMLTAFMAEPTTSANMVEQAFREAKAGHPKKALAYVNSVGASVIINSLLVSFVYALRDDDEDERFHDKYLEALLKELADGFNPLTYIPLAKDVWSIFQGWDVERVDMSLFKDLYDNLEKEVKTVKELVEGIIDGSLSEEEIKAGFKEAGEYMFPVLDTIASMNGVPLKNLRRDFYTMPKNTFKIFNQNQKDLSYSEKYLWDILHEAFLDQTPFGNVFMETRDNKLLDGMVSGNKVYLERLKKGYSSEDAYNNAVKAVIKNGYASKKLSLEKAKQLLVKYHGEDITEAEALLRTLDFKKAYADTSISDNQIKNYYLPIAVKNSDKLLKSPYEYGISEETYSKYVILKAECKGVDKNNDGKADSGSVKKEVMKVIDNLNLTKEQKDALYYDNGWAKGTLHEAPWR